MCGEHDKDVPVSVRITGSSPHVRGALRLDRFRVNVIGIIPACAGSTVLL